MSRPPFFISRWSPRMGAVTPPEPNSSPHPPPNKTTPFSVEARARPEDGVGQRPPFSLSPFFFFFSSSFLAFLPPRQLEHFFPDPPLLLFCVRMARKSNRRHYETSSFSFSLFFFFFLPLRLGRNRLPLPFYVRIGRWRELVGEHHSPLFFPLYDRPYYLAR